MGGSPTPRCLGTQDVLPLRLATGLGLALDSTRTHWVGTPLPAMGTCPVMGGKMSGRGPAPKPSGRRARSNADSIPSVVLQFRRAPQPELPEGVAWHPMTLAWWVVWQRSAQAETFTETDWFFLMDTALMHHAMWEKGQWTLAAEVRLRVAKFGCTPEDRARLRMVFADADEKDAKAERRTSSSRDRRGPLATVAAGE